MQGSLAFPSASSSTHSSMKGRGNVLHMSSAITQASSKAILQLLSTCSIGVYASKRGILDKGALSALSKLVFNIFQPCLLFVSVSSTVSASIASGSTGALELLPFLALVQITIGYTMGKLLSLVFYRKNPNIEASRFLRACTTFGNSGPLPYVFVDALFRGHPNPTLLPRSVAYISMYLLGWSPLFWILGPYLLSKNKGVAATSAAGRAQERKQLLQRILSPPILGSLAGLAAGATPAVMKLLQSGGILSPVYDGMRTLGAGYLPAVLLILSGSLMPQPPSSDEAGKEDASEKFDPKTIMKEVTAICCARFLVMPVIGAALMKLPFLSKAVGDPLLMFVLLLETCMPSAQNLTVILQLQGDRFAAGRMARLLLLVYMLGIPAINFWLTRILRITKLL